MVEIEREIAMRVGDEQDIEIKRLKEDIRNLLNYRT